MRRRLSSGFTLIELMVVIAIAAIMLGLAIPSFKEFIASQRVKSASYELSTSLLIARSEAIKRNADVTISPATANTWSAGWTVSAPGGVQIQTQPALESITVTTALPTVTFKSTGRPTAGGTFEVTSNGKTRCVKLDLAGSAGSTNGACS